MAEFVVAPKIVITVPTESKGIDIPALTMRIIKVAQKFQHLLNFYSFKPATSSIESFVGRTQNGVAKATTISTANCAIKITTGRLPLSPEAS